MAAVLLFVSVLCVMQFSREHLENHEKEISELETSLERVR